MLYISWCCDQLRCFWFKGSNLPVGISKDTWIMSPSYIIPRRAEKHHAELFVSPIGCDFFWPYIPKQTISPSCIPYVEFVSWWKKSSSSFQLLMCKCRLLWSWDPTDCDKQQPELSKPLGMATSNHHIHASGGGWGWAHGCCWYNLV
jgi:hypothetical protein